MISRHVALFSLSFLALAGCTDSPTSNTPSLTPGSGVIGGGSRAPGLGGAGASAGGMGGAVARAGTGGGGMSMSGGSGSPGMMAGALPDFPTVDCPKPMGMGTGGTGGASANGGSGGARAGAGGAASGGSAGSAGRSALVLAGAGGGAAGSGAAGGGAAGSTATAGRSGGTGGAPAGGAGGAPAAGGAEGTFLQVYALFRCGSCAGFCHGAVAGLNFGLSTNDIYDALLGSDRMGAPTADIAMQGACGGMKRVVPGKPDESVLYQKLANMATCGMAMPPPGTPDGPLFTPAQLEVVRSWIAAGAKKN